MGRPSMWKKAAPTRSAERDVLLWHLLQANFWSTCILEDSPWGNCFLRSGAYPSWQAQCLAQIPRHGKCAFIQPIFSRHYLGTGHHTGHWGLWWWTECDLGETDMDKGSILLHRRIHGGLCRAVKAQALHPALRIRFPQTFTEEISEGFLEAMMSKPRPGEKEFTKWEGLRGTF